MSIASSFEISKAEVFTRLAEHLIPLAVRAAQAGIPIREFERGLFGGLLVVGGRVIDAFLEAQGSGDRGETFERASHDSIRSQTLHRSDQPVSRPLRTIFGQHQFLAYVYRSGVDAKSSIMMRPVDEQLGLTADRYSPL